MDFEQRKQDGDITVKQLSDDQIEVTETPQPVVTVLTRAQLEQENQMLKQQKDLLEKQLADNEAKLKEF